jgi:Tol biopolymer transport system component
MRRGTKAGGRAVAQVGPGSRPGSRAGVRLGAWACVAVVAVPVPAASATSATADPEAPGTATRQVSVGLDGAPAGGTSEFPAISGDGRYVAFSSDAANLVPGDTNDATDVFVRDLRTGRTTRASVDSRGRQADRGSTLPALSADGRFVAFESTATNLVPGDTNAGLDVFVHDVRSGLTRRASLTAKGRQAAEGGGRPSLSASGRYVAFYSTSPDLVPGPQHDAQDAYLRDLRTGAVRRVSRGWDGSLGDGFSTPFGISDDGRRVVFESSAANLVPGDGNDMPDVFVYDDRTRRTTRVSVGPAGAEGNSYSLGGRLSGDGRYAAFGSAASDLVAGDTNGATDVFVHDLAAGETSRASVGADGGELSGDSLLTDISDDGGEVAFESVSGAGYDVFVRARVAQAEGAPGPAPGGATTVRVSVADDGGAGDGVSGRPAISGDGRMVVFQSAAANLVPGDTNGATDVFVHAWAS